MRSIKQSAGFISGKLFSLIQATIEVMIKNSLVKLEECTTVLHKNDNKFFFVKLVIIVHS